MKISVIIPAFNEEKYLSKTLEAILAQDYPILKSYSSIMEAWIELQRLPDRFQRVKVLYESRKGTMWACERGLQEAKGEYHRQNGCRLCAV